MILGVGNDLQDALARQTVGIEPYLTFPRTNDGPVQWVQLLNGFNQPDLYGWPLLTPLKVQMQKCEKCSREFCSTVNYRRHIRVHRRSLNVDKESYKNRDLLGAFWDKVSLDEAKRILSFEDVILEGITGSSIIKALESFVRAPGFYALPQVYVKAGYVLLDVIQATPSRLPISSQEFFTVLDDASERTFLCGGTAGSVQKYMFDGEAWKVGFEMKNLIACTSFLVEQNLVKAWIADRDAEALRCQKLLVEEEEASQRRQAELLERKRQRKLRQKEQKTKEQSYKETSKVTGAADILENVPYAELSSPPQSERDSHAFEDHNPSLLEPVHFFSNEANTHIEAQGGYNCELLERKEQSYKETDKLSGADNILENVPYADSSSPPQSEGNSHTLEDHNPSLLEPVDVFNNEEKAHIDAQGGYNSELLDIGIAKNVESPKDQGNNSRHLVDSKSQVLESISEWNSLHPGHKLRGVIPDSLQKHAPHRDLRVAPVNSSEIWTRKGTIENDCECITAVSREVEISQTDHTSCEVMIGSISVTVRNCITQKPQDDSHSEALQESCSIDHVTRGNVGAQDKPIKSESITSNTSLSNDKVLRHVNGHEVESQFVAQSGILGVGTMPGKSCLESSEVDNDSEQNDFIQAAKLPLSSQSARAFLTQRWKEAISGDHETLVLSQEPERQGHCDITNDCSEAASTVKAIDSEERSILGSAENRLGIMGSLEYPTNRHENAKRRRKPKKGYLIKVQC